MCVHFAPDRQLQEGHFALSGVRQIGDEAASSSLFGAGNGANAGKRFKCEMLFQPIAADDAVKIDTRPNDCVRRRIHKAFRHDDLTRGKARKLRLKRSMWHRDKFEIPC